MKDPMIFWAKVSALGQVGGAVATFLAVIVSLWIAFRRPRPAIRLTITEKLLIGGASDGTAFLTFEVTNLGERTVFVRGIGWRTGWFRKSPGFLQSKAALQRATAAETYGVGQEPPYELPPGQAISSYCEMENLIAYGRERAEPFFTRLWPALGRRATRVRGYVSTADGHMYYAKPPKALRDKLASAERDGDLENG
jgi:hypothetical protein